jgi:hypothetical protein
MRVAMLVLLTAVAVLAVFVLSNERNRDTIFDPEGFMREGAKFGVSIGQPLGLATAVLRRSNWRYFAAHNGGYCIRHRYTADMKVTVFFDGSWRKTTLCIASKHGRVVSIQWNAAPFTPEF